MEGSVTEDRELLAAIGQVVVNAAALEYSIAVLVAAVEGYRDQQCEDRAVAIVKASGGAMRALSQAACAQLQGQGMSTQRIARTLNTSTGRPITERDVRGYLRRWDREHPGMVPATQPDLIYLWRDAKAVLDDRHVIAHSLAMEDAEEDGQAGLVIFHPAIAAEMSGSR